MINVKLQNAITDSCPWWKNDKWSPGVEKRDILDEINRVLPLKQIISISGLRRVGKTSLMFYLIGELLKKEGPADILYFSFDNFSSLDIAELLDEYRALQNREFPRFLFLDEVQKVKNWQEQLKRIYDQKDIKIFVSGSESLFIRNYSRESLAGRIFEFRLSPLSFGEFLSFRGIETGPVFRKEVEREFGNYILTGGFPEMRDVSDRKIIREYIYSSIIEKTIFSDIPVLFKIDNVSVLKIIIDIFIDNPGMMVELSGLCGDLGISRQTLSNYLFYLESSNLVKKLYNFSRNRSTSEKKQKKYYITFPCLALYYDNQRISKVIENLCVLFSGSDFFWRNPQKDEVDIIKTVEDKIYPVEIKYSDSHLKRSILKFNRKFGAGPGFVVTRNTTEVKQEGGSEIHYVPVVDWMLGDAVAVG